MSKFVQTTYASSKEIMKFVDDVESLPVTLDDTGIVADVNGKKLIPAGTIIGGTGGVNSLFQNDAVKATEHNTQGGATGTAGAGVDAEGVLLDTVDVTYGPAPGAMVIEGVVNLGELPEAPCADAIAALKGRIMFVK